jgi:hypothetical protein
MNSDKASSIEYERAIEDEGLGYVLWSELPTWLRNWNQFPPEIRQQPAQQALGKKLSEAHDNWLSHFEQMPELQMRTELRAALNLASRETDFVLGDLQVGWQVNNGC